MEKLKREQGKLISTVMVSEGDFPLRLPSPTALNSGGYLVQVKSTQGMVSQYAYSHIDMLVAGLEAWSLGVEVTDLSKFFDRYRVMYSDTKVTLTLLLDGQITIRAISDWKLLILTQDVPDVRRILSINAPLTFKWVGKQ